MSKTSLTIFNSTGHFADPRADRSMNAATYAMQVTPGRSRGQTLSDAEWNLIAPYMLPFKTLGRPRTTLLRDVVNVILYLLRSGCPPLSRGRLVAVATQGLPAALDRATPLARQRSVGAHQSPSPDGDATSRGARRQSICRHHRQPVGQDHRKRRPTGL